MKFIPTFGEITLKGKEAFKRFPITLIWAIIGTIFIVYYIENDTIDEAFTIKLTITFILGISWLIGSRFFIEQFKKKKQWIVLITLIFLFLFYWNISIIDKSITAVSWIRFSLYFFTGHLFLLIAPFVFIKEWKKEIYFNYLKSVLIAIARSLFFSFILYLGIILALLAIDHLFNADINEKRYFQIFVICLGIANTWIYLSDFPKDIYNQVEINYTKALEVLVKYILIPLVILYLIILYAYSIKIMINWNLPKGWVSYLVIVLSFLGFIIQLLIDPIQKTIRSRTINRFHPWFYFLLLPLIGLLFIAIFRRISDYGFTENRYFVLTLACWILGMTFYMLFSKKRQIQYFSLTLALTILLISVGFWGVFSVSNQSQLSRFSRSFNQMKEKNFEIAQTEKQQFESIIRYLSKKGVLHETESVLGYNPISEFEDISSWSMATKISDSLGIKVTDATDPLYNSHYYRYDLENSEDPVPVKDFDYLKKMNFNAYEKKRKLRGYEFYLENKTNTIRVNAIENDLFYILDINDLIKSLLENKSNKDSQNLSSMLFVKEFEELKIQILFLDIGLSYSQTTKDTVPQINYASTLVFIKKKEL